MRRRALANLVLAAAVAGGAALLFLGKAPQHDNEVIVLTNLDPAAIERIRVVRKDKEPLSFQRSGDAWRMTAPVTAPAHNARIRALLALARDQSFAQLDVKGLDLERFGIGEPVARVFLDDREFDFGDVSPLDHRRYVQVGGTVHLIDDSLFSQIIQDAGFFIDNRLLPEGPPPDRIAYPDFTLSANGGAWRSDPTSERTPEQVKDLALEWENARAITVRIKTPDSAGPRIRIEREGTAPIVFEIAAVSPHPVLFRRDLGLEYHLADYTAEQLLVVPAPEGEEAQSRP